jgi:RNA polymerase sigma-70 factor (ECF subfamily)
MNIEGLENSQETIYNKLFEQYYAPFCLFARRFIEDDDICKDIRMFLPHFGIKKMSLF